MPERLHAESYCDQATRACLCWLATAHQIVLEPSCIANQGVHPSRYTGWIQYSQVAHPIPATLLCQPLATFDSYQTRIPDSFKFLALLLFFALVSESLPFDRLSRSSDLLLPSPEILGRPLSC